MPPRSHTNIQKSRTSIRSHTAIRIRKLKTISKNNIFKKATQDKKSNKLVNINNLDEVDDVYIDFDKLVKREYQRLMRQYRLMEDERHTVTAKGNALSKQAKLLDLLYDELKSIKTDLYNVESKKFKYVDKRNTKTILQTMNGFERANNDIGICLKNLRENSSNVDKIAKYLVEHNLKVQTVYGNTMSVTKVEKKRRVLENRLYFFTTKFCMKISDNKAVRRDEINLSLKLRGLFYTRHIGLKRQIHSTKVKMSEIVFLSTQAYDQRDEIVGTIRLLGERNEKENRQHIIEMKEYNRILQHDTIVRRFLRRKTVSRNILESEKQRAHRKKYEKLTLMDYKIALYIRSFKSILKKSNFRTMEDLIRHYNQLQQHNFAMFRYNCDLNHEIVVLKEETEKMSSFIENLYQMDSERHEEIKFETKAALMKKELLEIDLDKLNVMYTKTEINMEEILQILDNLFTMIGCSITSLRRFLGNRDGIRAKNAIFCMQLIDSRIHELVLTKHVLEMQNQIEILQIHPKGRAMGPEPKIISAGGPYIPNVLISNHVEDGEEEGEDRTKIRAFTYIDLRKQLLEGSRKKKVHMELLNFNEETSVNLDIQTLVRNEFLRLNRQYRMVEEERRRVIERGKFVSKQARIMDLLRDDIEHQETDLYYANSPQRIKIDNELKTTIIDRLEKIAQFREYSAHQMELIKDQGDHIDKITDILINHKIRVTSLYGSGTSAAGLEKRLRVLENNLYRVTSKHDSVVSINKRNRHEITLNLKLRGMFFRKYSALKEQQQFLRNEMNEVVYCCSSAYDQRGFHFGKIRILRERNEKDTKQHLLDIKELQRMIDNDIKLTTFLTTKNKERDVEETRIHRQGRKNYLKYIEMEGIIREYSHVFRIILNELEQDGKSGGHTIGHFVKRYNDHEHNNFTFFQKGIDINQQIIVLKYQLLENVEVIDEFYTVSNQRRDDLQKELKLLEEKKLHFENELKQTEEMFYRKSIDMDEVMELLNTLSTEIGANQFLMRLLLGYDGKVTLRTILPCISGIETRLRELKTKISDLENRQIIGKSGHQQQYIRSPAPTSDNKKTKYGGPYIPDVVLGMLDTSDEDRDDHPLRFNELKNRIYQLILTTPSARSRADGVSTQVSSFDIFRRSIASSVSFD